MLFNEADEELVKTWVIKKLEDVSDADADVLADYVLALIKTDEPEATAKANCIDNLKDFLSDGSEKFVDELFTALASKSYDPSRPPPKQALAPYQPPRRASFDPPPQQRGSKKRSYHDWDREESQGGGRDVGERPVKQARRGGRGFDRGGWQQYMPPPPTPPPGIPSFDLSNPLGSIHALYSAMGMMMPGFSAPTGVPPMPIGFNPNRCLDYDTKGFCTRGAHCPFEHGEDPHIVTGNEYDPNNATLLHVEPTRTGVVSTSPSTTKRGGQRGRVKNRDRKPQRTELSQHGPNYDRSITTIVVEQIPKDKLNEESIRAFFGEFGNIQEVKLQPRRKIAVIKYEAYDEALAAYASPKVIFDNRFVKVYWHIEEDITPYLPHAEAEASLWQHIEDGGLDGSEPEVNLEEVKKKQEEAQRKHEEKRRKLSETQQQRDAISARLQEIESQKRTLTAKMNKSKPPTDDNEASEHTKALRAQLAKLEEEAKTLGIDPNTAPSDWSGLQHSYRGRGRGGHRGQYRGRGGSYRGGWGGPVARGGAVRRLDNRPKTVCVAFAEGTFNDHEESLRSYLLLNSSESATLNKHPDKADAALIAFPERYLAEAFWDASQSPMFPAKTAELSWWSQPVSEGMNGTTSGDRDGDVQMEPPSEASEPAQVKDEEPADPRDLDVADEDDRWG